MSASKVGGAAKAVNLLRTLPRVQINNLKSLPGTHKAHKKPRGQHNKIKSRDRGSVKHGTLPHLGFDGSKSPFYLKMPKEPYYKGIHVRRQYPPLSLMQLQRLVDLGRVDVTQPIDLTTLCNTFIVTVDMEDKHYGVELTDEGADIFCAPVNIEVQRASETAIAAVERAGGVITTRFYDAECVIAMSNPVLFLMKGLPIPRCKLPPEDAIDYYRSAESRGYLADPAAIAAARIDLAQKYGYELPDLSQHPDKDMLLKRKDPRQIWYGLEPGWMVNMRERYVMKPTDKDLVEYYKS